jgi:hypothetical protein
MELKFEKNTLSKRLFSMLSVDFKRMIKSRLFYIMLGISLVVPVLIVVMTTLMDGSVTVNPQTGVETVIEGFKNAWQSIGAKSDVGMSMDLTGMCNINLMFFAIAVFIALFISDDFRSGYSKNIFTVRSKKIDYVISKMVFGYIVGVLMLICYFIGSMLGGAISSLPFTLEGVTAGNIVFCMLSKLFLMLVFVAIFTTISIATKAKAWLSICCSLGGGMLLFMMIPSLTPLDSTMVNVVLCLVCGISFAFGLVFLSNLILKKTSLI